jgi:hypothetical protein
VCHAISLRLARPHNTLHWLVSRPFIDHNTPALMRLVGPTRGLRGRSCGNAGNCQLRAEALSLRRCLATAPPRAALHISGRNQRKHERQLGWCDRISAGQVSFVVDGVLAPTAALAPFPAARGRQTAAQATESWIAAATAAADDGGALPRSGSDARAVQQKAGVINALYKFTRPHTMAGTFISVSGVRQPMLPRP